MADLSHNCNKKNKSKFEFLYYLYAILQKTKQNSFCNLIINNIYNNILMLYNIIQINSDLLSNTIEMIDKKITYVQQFNWPKNIIF